MKLTVFGAAGRTGRRVVEQALARGHDVTAFVRSPAELPGARVVEGDARDAAAVDRTIEGADAVISVLSLASPELEPQHSEAMRVIADAAERLGVRRVVVTANNDALTEDELTGEFAAMGREHRRNRATLEVSGLDWTMGAAGWVTDDPPTGTYAAVVDAKAPSRKIATADFATFALDALERDEWIGHVVGVSAAPTD